MLREIGIAENLSTARLVAPAAVYRSAISSLYYAAHHTVSALLAAHGLEAVSHDGAQTQFGLHFSNTSLGWSCR